MTTLKYSNTDSISFAQDQNNATSLILTVNNSADTCGGTIATFTNAVITGIDTSVLLRLFLSIVIQFFLLAVMYKNQTLT